VLLVLVVVDIGFLVEVVVLPTIIHQMVPVVVQEVLMQVELQVTTITIGGQQILAVAVAVAVLLVVGVVPVS
jgi:hypothetical protein